jgi:hypothetical protein
MSDRVCPEPGCDWSTGSICRTHILTLVPSSQKREPQGDAPVNVDPGHAAAPDPAAGKCWHCGAPIPDPAAKRCVQCAKPLIRLALMIEFTGGHVKVATGEQTLLGRDVSESPHAQLFTDYKNVSRQHATIGVDRDGAWIRDEESCNGTFVNGAPITEQERHPLADGDQVRLGASVTGRVNLRPPS